MVALSEEDVENWDWPSSRDSFSNFPPFIFCVCELLLFFIEVTKVFGRKHKGVDCKGFGSIIIFVDHPQVESLWYCQGDALRRY